MNTKQKKAVADLHASGHNAPQIAKLLGLDALEVHELIKLPAAQPTAPKPAKPKPGRDQGQRNEAAWREARRMLRAEPATRAPQTLESYNAHLRASTAGAGSSTAVRGGDRKI